MTSVEDTVKVVRRAVHEYDLASFIEDAQHLLDYINSEEFGRDLNSLVLSTDLFQITCKRDATKIRRWSRNPLCVQIFKDLIEPLGYHVEFVVNSEEYDSVDSVLIKRLGAPAINSKERFFSRITNKMKSLLQRKS